MENWLVAVIGLAICVVAILFVSGIKVIAKKIAEAKKKEIDMKKAEYPLAAISMILAYGGVVAFLYFGVMNDIYTAMKTAIPFALSVQSLYIFIVQLARKGFTGFFTAIKNLVTKLKSSKNPIQELPAIISEATETETETNEEIGKKLYNEIFKDSK